MSCFQLPKWLLQRIDAIRRQFLWNGAKPVHKIHLLNWRSVCLPITCGGLGVVDLHLQNIALLLRWWWRLFTPDRKLWRSYASLLYALPSPQPAPLILTQRGSFFWKSLSSLRPLFHSCSQFQILSGKNISLWYDGWDGLPLLPPTTQPSFGRRLSLFQARNRTHLIFPAPVTSQQHSILQKLMLYVPCDQPDKLIWKISPTGSFSVRSVYAILSQGGKTKSPFTSIWKAKVTPSMKCFFFLLLNERILTHDVMLRRHLNHTPGCVMCLNCPSETAVHLFFECPYASYVWTVLSHTAGYQILKPQQTTQQTYLSSKPIDIQLRQKWMSIFITASSMLWRERNDRTFQRRSTPAHILATRISQEADLCFTWC